MPQIALAKDVENAKSNEEFGLYQARLAKAVARRNSITGEPPAATTTPAIVHALSALYPQTKYPVAKNARLFSALSNVVPDRVVDYILKHREEW